MGSGEDFVSFTRVSVMLVSLALMLTAVSYYSEGSGNLWCIFFYFLVTFFFPSPLLSLIHVSSHYAQINFTYKLLNLICGECTEFKHINKYFNFHQDSLFYWPWFIIQW